MNRLLIAALVVIVLAAALFFAFRNEETVTTPTDRPSPLAAIDSSQVTKVVLDSSVGEKANQTKQHVVLTRGEGEGDSEPVWFLEEPIKAEANGQAVKTLLQRLGELKVLDVASEMANSHENLEVTPEKGVTVRVFNGDDQLAYFILGKSTGGNTMMSLPDQDFVYRLAGSLRYVFGKRTADWRNKEVFNLERDQISWVQFKNQNGTFAFSRDLSADDSNWTIESVDALPPPPAEEEAEAEEEGPAKAGKRPPAKQPPTKAEPERATTIENLDPASRCVC